MSEAREFDRHSQIWAAMYGPTRATDAIERARALRAEQPAADLKALLDSCEPGGGETDPDEAGAARPGVG